MARPWWRWIGLLALVVMLSGCETTPAAPLLSPIELARSYGYSEVAQGDNRYAVTYLGPSRRGFRSASSRQEMDAAQRTQAYDFALWHAAQIALAQGFAGFRVGNVQTNVNTINDDSYDPYYGSGWPGYGPAWYGPGYPYRGPYPGPYWGPSPYVLLQTQVTMDVTLLRSPGPGEYEARDVIEQLRRTYPGADGTVMEGGPR